MSTGGEPSDSKEADSATNPLQRCYRSRLMIVEVALVGLVLMKSFYTPLCEQYYYHKFGSVVLQNTSFEFPNGSFCVSSELINNNTGSNDSYKVVESQSNHLVAYTQVAATIPSVVITVILGPLMDKYGRKIGMILPVIGSALQGILSIFIVKFDLNPYYFILANFLGGVLGSFTCFLAASFSYVADVSSVRWRSLRVGIMESALAFGSMTGHLLGGFWLQAVHCNFVPLFGFFVGCNLLVVIYVIFVIPESLSRSERVEMRRHNPKGYLQGFKIYFGALSCRSTWKLYVTNLVVNVTLINSFGASYVDVYFLKALPFNFDPLKIGLYQGIRSASQGLANFLLMMVLVALKVGDVWIMILATAVHCSSNVLLGFANKTWQLFTIASVKGVEGITWSGGRGLLSKLVRPEQQGSLFSVVASIESIGTLLAGTIWPLVFPLTLQHNMKPGMTYIFMAGVGALLFPPLISLLFLKKEQPLSTAPKNSLHVQYREGNHTPPSATRKKTEYSPLLD